jgi:glycerophosphoryl diester phosphodiesterase
LGKFPQAKIIVASFKLDELTTLHELDPKLKIYNLERSHAVEAINMARIMGFDGVGLKFWLLNPFTYWLARRSGLELYVYTVNSKFLGKFLAALYPKAAICTDHPEWFTKPPKLVRSKRR